MIKKYKSGIIYFTRLFRRCLRLVFNFDRWHLSTLMERKYALDIIEYLNKLPPAQRINVIEIGCGLGDIIRNLHFENKIGYDRDKNVLKAARFLNYITFSRTKIFKFSFPSSSLQDKHNAVIMVNWIHHIKPELLKQTIAKYYIENVLVKGCIVVDTIQSKEYEFNHDINYLTCGLSCKVVKIGSNENQREVFAIIK